MLEAVMRGTRLIPLVVAALIAAPALAQSARSVWTGIYTTEQATRGEQLYIRACAECHGDDLEGRERAPALAGVTFSQRWDGAALKKLFERLEEMPPAKPEARLTSQQYIDVLAFLLSANEIPAGTMPLDTEKKVLADITYTSQRPRF
jgi:S-disulfanyl-L-cysteine oxidoreductase SoxD